MEARTLFRSPALCWRNAPTEYLEDDKEFGNTRQSVGISGGPYQYSRLSEIRCNRMRFPSYIAVAMKAVLFKTENI
jgi:hypothetical protein